MKAIDIMLTDFKYDTTDKMNLLKVMSDNFSHEFKVSKIKSIKSHLVIGIVKIKKDQRYFA